MPKEAPLFVVINTEYEEEPTVLIANEGRVLTTITTRRDSSDPAPRTYQLKRMGGALILIEVTP